MYLQKALPRQRRFLPPGLRMTHARPLLRGLRASRPVGLGAGINIQQLATSAPSIAGSAAASAAGIGAGTALGIAIPIVGVALGALIGSIFAAHEKRVAGAKEENANLADLMPTVIQAFQAVFAQLNSGAATPAQGIQALQQIQSQYWQDVAQFETGPGQAGGPAKCVRMTCTGGAPVPSCLPMTPCNRGCTASCCVGCNSIQPWVMVATKLIQSGGGAYTIPAGGGSQFGFSGTPAFTITYTPPPPGSVTGAGSAVGSVISDVASGTIFGIPVWILGVVAVIGGIAVFK